MVKISVIQQIDYCWKSVEKSPDESYVFPHRTSNFMKSEYSRPGIYRWVVYSPNGAPVAAYFGEAENLVKRIGQYLRPGESQRTNLRLHMEFHRYIKNQRTVKMDILDFSPFRLNSIEASVSDLHNRCLRIMLEAFAILNFKSSRETKECRLMNLQMSSPDRKIRRAIEIISETTTDAPEYGPEGSHPPSQLRGPR